MLGKGRHGKFGTLGRCDSINMGRGAVIVHSRTEIWSAGGPRRWSYERPRSRKGEGRKKEIHLSVDRFILSQGSESGDKVINNL